MIKVVSFLLAVSLCIAVGCQYGLGGPLSEVDGPTNDGGQTSDALPIPRHRAVVLVQASRAPREIAIDNTNIYWLQSDALLKKAKDGGPTETIAKSIVQPGNLAVYQGQLYWTSVSSLWRVSTKGGAPEEIVRNKKVTSFVLLNDKLYWASSDEIYVMPAKENVYKVLYQGTTTRSLAVDSAHIYWHNFHKGEIHKGNTNGTSSARIKGLTPNDGIVRLWETLSYIYWQPQYTHDFFRIAKGGGKSELVAQNIVLRRSVWDEGWLYWTNYNQKGGILRMKPGVTSPQIVISDLGFPDGIAVDKEYVYWSEYTTKRILRLKKP